jgi:hypothetical protein
MSSTGRRGYRDKPPEKYVKAPTYYRDKEKRDGLLGNVWVWNKDNEEDLDTAEGTWNMCKFSGYVQNTEKFTLTWPSGSVTEFGPSQPQFDWGDFSFPPSLFSSAAARPVRIGAAEGVAAAAAAARRGGGDGVDNDDDYEDPPAAAAVIADTGNPPWPSTEEEPIDFTVMMNALKKVDGDNLGVNKKKIAQTYNAKAWDNLNATQKNKVTAFWTNLGDYKDVVVAACIANTRALARVPGTGAKAPRSENTVSDDLVRLLHIFFDPALTALKTKVTKGTKSRQELEDKDGDVWAEFAEAFNNYRTHVYENEAVQYRDGVKILPFKTRHSRFQLIAAATYDLDPTAPNRPDRDGKWVKEKWKDLRREISIVYANFTKSGKQEGGQDEEIDWLAEETAVKWGRDYCDRSAFPKVIKYSFVLLDRGSFDELGRMLPDGVGRDDGKPGDGRTRKIRKGKTKRGRSGSQSTMDADNFDSAAALNAAAQESNSIAALTALLGPSIPEKLRAQAQQRLQEIAFRPAPVTGRKRGRSGNKDSDDEDEDDDDDDEDD